MELGWNISILNSSCFSSPFLSFSKSHFFLILKIVLNMQLILIAGVAGGVL